MCNPRLTKQLQSRLKRVEVLTVLAACLLFACCTETASKSFFANNSGRKSEISLPFIRDKWAVLIGVDKYSHQPGAANTVAACNVDELSSALRSPFAGKFAPDHVIAITGASATTIGITQTVDDWLIKKTLPDDMIILYISGDCFIDSNGSQLLRTYDSNSKTSAGQLDLKVMITNLRSRTQSRNIICVIDATTSGTTRLDFTGLSGEGITVLSAAAAGQKSLRHPGASSSLFTHHLAQVILQTNGSLTLEEAYQAVRALVLSESQSAFHQIQTPLLAVAPMNPSSRLISFGTVPHGLPQRKTFDMGHPVDRLALERPEMIPPRMGGKAVMIIPRKKSNAGNTSLLSQAIPVRADQLVQSTQLPLESDSAEMLSLKAAQSRNTSLSKDPYQPAKESVAMLINSTEEAIPPANRNELSVYLDDMKRAIQIAWRRPACLENRRITAVFSIAPDGRIINTKILESSGVIEADQTALETLQMISPLAPPPANQKQNLDVKYVFESEAHK